MPTIDVLDIKGNKVGTMELSDAIFAAGVSTPSMHTVVKSYLANQRQGTQSALTRGEVSGGGKKPWRQKGTGRARQGSTRAPQWTHGGVAFAPKPRDYSFSVNKKVRRLALKSALSSRFADGDIIVVDEISFNEIKTKNVAEMFKALGVEKKGMIVTADVDQTVVKSARNIPGTVISPAVQINTYDVLNCGKFIATKAAIEKIEEVFA